jgi:intermediate peptidase
MNLQEKMAKTPETVLSFLDQMERTTLPETNNLLRSLQNLKRDYEGQSDFYPWDLEFYRRLLLKTFAGANVSSYFPIDTVIKGLSGLLTSLYGVHLEYQRDCDNEVWHSDVFKLVVIHESLGKVGTLYCDLFERKEEKYTNPAHFTIRCRRRIDDDIYEQTLTTGETLKLNSKVYQLPIIAIVTNLSKATKDTPCLLNLHEIETLFHEFGHAMHCT